MNIGIYVRKSVYTDNSESINAQYNMCVEYCKNNFKNYTIVKYSDEGFSGANTKRPDFNKMMEAIETNMLDIIVCYRIDRVSRSVLDFSKFFSLLEEKDVKFVSVTEKIDTSTPSGRAMMYMTSVFGQMERESIAERVKDTMLDMAKNGLWCGGRPPVGYKIIPTYIKGKEHKTLSVDKDSISFYKTLVDLFICKGLSLNGIVTYLKRKGITTSPQGGRLATNMVYQIISNPVYVQADEVTYEYFKNKGCKMAVDKSKFDGTRALIRYGRTVGSRARKHQVKSMEEWTISVGLHNYIIDSKTYMEIVSKFGVNKINKIRQRKIGIVHGILKCKCGSNMRAKYKYDKKYNVEYKTYFCRQRETYGKEACNMKSISLEEIDKAIIDILKNIALDKSLIEQYKETDMFTPSRTSADIKDEISNINKKIKNLTMNLSLSNAASKYIVEEIEHLDSRLNTLKIELIEHEQNKALESINNKDVETTYNQICDLVKHIEDLDYTEIQYMLRSILKECTWDGKTLHIKI